MENDSITRGTENSESVLDDPSLVEGISCVKTLVEVGEREPNSRLNEVAAFPGLRPAPAKTPPTFCVGESIFISSSLCESSTISSGNITLALFFLRVRAGDGIASLGNGARRAHSA